MIVETEAQLEYLCRRIESAEVVAVDTETTGLHLYQDDVLRGISIAIGEDTWYVPVSHPDSPQMDPHRVVLALNRTDATALYHHATFDWAALHEATHTFAIPHRFWDTQVGDWLLDENMPHGLKDVGARLFGHNAKAEQEHLKALRRGRKQTDIYKELRQTEEWGAKGMAQAAREEAKALAFASKRDWDTFTAADIADYAEKDARLTYDIYPQQVGEIYEPYPGQPEVFHDVDREMRFQHTLYRMMRHGIRVSAEEALAGLVSARNRLEQLDEAFGGINLNSPQQLGELLYGQWGLKTRHLTKGGSPSTSRETLEELEGMHPGVELILEHRQLQKAVSAYYEPLVHRIGNDGRVHTAFNSARTVTGRLSSSDPNLQTIPTSFSHASRVRDLFIPAEGMELWEYDLSQAELRVAAGYADEQNMISAIEDGRDLHGEVAASIWGAEYTDEHRRLAKNLNYGFSYGIGPAKFATYLVHGTGRPISQHDLNEAAAILNGYRATYPGLARLMGFLDGEAKRTGYIPLHVPGRYRRFRGPGYNHRRTYTALNFIVQGGVAEFLKDVMMEAEPVLRGAGATICLQIHDSLVMEVEPGSGLDIARRLQVVSDQINPFKMAMPWDAKPWHKGES